MDPPLFNLFHYSPRLAGVLPPEKTCVLFHANLLIHDSLPQHLYRIFIDPLAYQLWFLHDLMLLVLASPLLVLLICHIPRLFLIGVGLLWLLDYPAVRLVEALLFFSLGVALRRSGTGLRQGAGDGYRVILWPGLARTSTLLTFLLSPYAWMVYKAQILAGLPALLYLGASFRASRLLVLARYTFPIFLLHEPLLVAPQLTVVMLPLPFPVVVSAWVDVLGVWVQPKGAGGP